MPELRFFEQRISILRKLEKAGLLQAFRVGEESVDAQLSDWRWLSVAQSGITLNVLTEAESTIDELETIKAIVKEIEPSHYSHARASYQHVFELPFNEFDKAMTRGHDRLYRELSTDEVALGDWALLTDIAAAGPPPSRGQIEFGIVRDGEVPFRLNRLGGRGPGMQHLGQREWEPDAFKKVSLFAESDLRCDAESGREAEFLGDALAFWNASRTQMTRLITELRRKMIDNQDGGTR